LAANEYVVVDVAKTKEIVFG